MPFNASWADMFGGGGGGASGIASGAGTGAAIGSVVPGLGTAVGAGVGALFGGLKGLFGNRAAKNEAKNQKALLDWKLINEMQKPLDRRRALLSGLMSQLAKADPEHKTYGSFWSPEMFGDLGGTLTSKDWTYNLAPQAKTQSGLSAFLGGALGGVGDFITNEQAARNAAQGRIGWPPYNS